MKQRNKSRVVSETKAAQVSLYSKTVTSLKHLATMRTLRTKSILLHIRIAKEWFYPFVPLKKVECSILSYKVFPNFGLRIFKNFRSSLLVKLSNTSRGKNGVCYEWNIIYVLRKSTGSIFSIRYELREETAEASWLYLTGRQVACKNWFRVLFILWS